MLNLALIALSALFLTVSSGSFAQAAEIVVRQTDRSVSKRVIGSECRTGWWRIYHKGDFRPRWQTRCQVVLARR